MRVYIYWGLFLSCSGVALPQTIPTGWKTIEDTKAVCQIAVPPDWVPLGDNLGAAVYHDATTAIAVVTSQPGREFKPLTPLLLKVIGIPKEYLFENSIHRIYYQEKKSRNADDNSVFDSSVPGKGGGTCSCHVAVLPVITEDVAKKIALSLSPARDKT